MADKTMHHVVIGDDTFELIDKAGREETTGLKEDLTKSVDGNGNVYAGKNIVDLKKWLDEKNVRYTETNDTIVFQTNSNLVYYPYVFSDADIPVSVEWEATSSGGTRIEILDSSNNVIALPGMGCKARMNYSTGSETTVTKFGIYYDIMSNEALTTNKEDKNDAQAKFSSIVTQTLFDLLKGHTPLEKTLLNQNTGEKSASTAFFTYENIDVSDYYGARIHTYSSAIQGTAYSRFCFYNSSNQYISGAYPNESDRIGVEVPKDAKWLSICFSYKGGDYRKGKPEEYWAKFTYDTESIKINDAVNYNRKSDIFMPYKGKRKPTIAIVMDGDFANNSRIVGVAEEHGLRIGFGAPFKLSEFRNNGVNLYRMWQENGHELLVHGLYKVGADSPYTEEEIAEKIKEAYDSGISLGYDLHGYVCYQGKSVPSSVKEIKKYFDYSFSQINHSGEFEPCMYIYTDTPYTMFRYSMEVSTLQQQKDAVDRCIETNGFLCLYGHSDNEGGNFTPENFSELCDYIVAKINDNAIYFNTPYKAIQHYFTPRFSDLYESVVDITNKITIDNRFDTITKRIMFDTVHNICYVNMRIRANQDISGTNITFASGYPYSLTRYYVGTNKPAFGIFIGDDVCKANDSITINNGEDIFISASYYTYRAYNYNE